MALITSRFLVFKQLYRFPVQRQLDVSIMNANSRPGKYFHVSSSVRNFNPKDLGIHFKQPKAIRKLLTKDNVPENYTLIYKAPMELYLRAAYPISILLGVGAPLVAYALHWYQSDEETVVSTEKLNFYNTELELGIFLTVTILFAISGFAVIFKYPFRIYKHKDKQEYLAIFTSHIPLLLRQFYFKQATNTKFRNPLYSLVSRRQFYLNDSKPAFLLEDYFRTPRDMCEMLGIK